MATLSLNLVVDKKKKRVLFAEADQDFVDVLCSFLTLPLGTVARVLGKRLMLGCVDRLYGSVQNLDAKYLQTKACKRMLLEPRSEAERLCEGLTLSADDSKPRRIYRCPAFECFTRTHRLYSSVSGARCPCGKAMDKLFQYERKQVPDGNGVFVKGGGKTYIITDDLHVRPVRSMESALSIFRQHGIKNSKTVETKKVDIGRGEILNLLKRLLVSATPLTDVFLLKLDPSKVCRGDDQECDQPIDITRIKSEDDATAAAAKSIQLKLLYDKVSKKVLSAQAGEDFVDILFSFLTFPLGCIVKLLERSSSIRCLDNLYKSIECSGGGECGELDCIRSEERKKLLLAPKLHSHFGCSNQLLRVEEGASGRCVAHGCEDCWRKFISIPGKMCEKHNIAVVNLAQVNPKLPSCGTERGGGYAKKAVRFMITDGMAVTPFSSLSGIDAIKESKATISSLAERDVTLGEIEVLRLLKACLVTRGALSNAFSCMK